MEPAIAHRELRNRSGEILRSVEAGETYTVTNRGKPVARLTPVSGTDISMPLHRPATIRGGFARLTRHTITISSEETLDELRGDR